MNAQELDQYLRTYTTLEELYRKRPARELSPYDPNLYADYHPKFVDDSEWGNLSKVKQLLEHPADMSDIVFPTSRNIIFLCPDRFTGGRMHRHSFIELIYVYSGHCETVVNENALTLNQGDICILDTNTSHLIDRAEENDIIINCLMQKAYFTSAFFGRLAENDLLSGFFINALYESRSINRYLLFRHHTDSQVPDIMMKLLCEYHDKKQCYAAVVDSYMIILFTELLRGYSRIIAPDADRIPSDFRLSEVVRYIQDHCDTVTLAETAAHFNYESAYLSKMIKRFSNQTFISLRNEARLLKARLLLENTDMKIDAIARETGYENLHFFYGIFRKKYNQTPAEYRKEFRYSAETPTD